MTEFLHEVLLDGLLDVLKLLPFLFLTYLLMEFIEHKAKKRTEEVMKKTGALGPLVGGLAGAVPQCGFSAAAANLYAGRIISMGTLVAVFLSTSDEMLPLLISDGVPALRIVALLGTKVLVGVATGFCLDLFVRRRSAEDEHVHVEELCEKDGCHCEGGILKSALHHTLHIARFRLVITWGIGTVVFFVGAERLGGVLYNRPVLSHALAVLVGLIPNCAASVALTQFYLDGFITAGTLLSGLLPGAGVGLLVLWKVNPGKKENMLILAVLVLVGFVVGLLSDVTGFSALLGTL